MEAVALAAIPDDHQTSLQAFTQKHNHEHSLKPAHIYNGKLTGGAYHYGHMFRIYVKGEVGDVLHKCIMTENEREKATMEYLHCKGLGLTVLAFASTSNVHATPLPHLEFLGIIGLRA